MITDCEKCANKDTDICKSCAETSDGKPSMFKQSEKEASEE